MEDFLGLGSTKDGVIYQLISNPQDSFSRLFSSKSMIESNKVEKDDINTVDKEIFCFPRLPVFSKDSLISFDLKDNVKSILATTNNRINIINYSALAKSSLQFISKPTDTEELIFVSSNSNLSSKFIGMIELNDNKISFSGNYIDQYITRHVRFISNVMFQSLNEAKENEIFLEGILNDQKITIKLKFKKNNWILSLGDVLTHSICVMDNDIISSVTVNKEFDKKYLIILFISGKVEVFDLELSSLKTIFQPFNLINELNCRVSILGDDFTSRFLKAEYFGENTDQFEDEGSDFVDIVVEENSLFILRSDGFIIGLKPFLPFTHLSVKNQQLLLEEKKSLTDSEKELFELYVGYDKKQDLLIIPKVQVLSNANIGSYAIGLHLYNDEIFLRTLTDGTVEGFFCFDLTCQFEVFSKKNIKLDIETEKIKRKEQKRYVLRINDAETPMKKKEAKLNFGFNKLNDVFTQAQNVRTPKNKIKLGLNLSEAALNYSANKIQKQTSEKLVAAKDTPLRELLVFCTRSVFQNKYPKPYFRMKLVEKYLEGFKMIQNSIDESVFCAALESQEIIELVTITFPSFEALNNENIEIDGINECLFPVIEKHDVSSLKMKNIYQVCWKNTLDEPMKLVIVPQQSKYFIKNIRKKLISGVKKEIKEEQAPIKQILDQKVDDSIEIYTKVFNDFLTIPKDFISSKESKEEEESVDKYLWLTKSLSSLFYNIDGTTNSRAPILSLVNQTSSLFCRLSDQTRQFNEQFTQLQQLIKLFSEAKQKSKAIEEKSKLLYELQEYCEKALSILNDKVVDLTKNNVDLTVTEALKEKLNKVNEMIGQVEAYKNVTSNLESSLKTQIDTTFKETNILQTAENSVLIKHTDDIVKYFQKELILTKDS